MTPQQTKQAIRELIPQGIADYQIPDKVSPEALERFCSGVAGVDFGRCFAWVDDTQTPRGILVGMVFSDPMTGVMTGFEHLWWVAPDYRNEASLLLMTAFENECRASGCRRVIFGLSHHISPKSMVRMYRKHGYREYNTAVVKEL